MEYSESVVDIFHGHIESCMYTMESLSGSIAIASESIANGMLHENKVLCCGEGSFGLIAQHLASNLLNRFSHERPSLPAIALSADAYSATAIAADSGYNDIFANQIRALGQDGDHLVLCYHGNGSANTLRCIQAAHERNMRIISLCSVGDSDASALLSPNDIELAIPVTNRARAIEVQLIAVHSICELIDTQLFGAQPS
ncbi:MAG: SIS domain-containing protein [Spongiibacteraceae bacterium]